MADITKCGGQSGTIICPFREKCYRFTATSSSWQSYFSEMPLKDSECGYYWEIKL